VATKRVLGQTGIEVTPIGLGVMQFAGGSGPFRLMFRDLTTEQMNGIVRSAIEAGINWFDTAEVYGRGRSERGLARGLKTAGPMGQEAIIATKWFPLFRTSRNIPRTIRKRQTSLDGYNIDLYQVHNNMFLSSPAAVMNAMADLVDAGKVRSVGVSNFGEQQMREAHAVLAKRGIPLASNQVQFNLLHRRIESNGVLSAAKELGITIIAWSPLASGLLTGKFHNNSRALKSTPAARRMMLRKSIVSSRPVLDTLEEIAEAYDATPGQIALSWMTAFHGETIVAIPGASEPGQAAQNGKAMELTLSRRDMERIDRSSEAFR
jgi:aryl-alcohol dehydrogenase-like predicted oxidoreductase